MLLVRQYKFEHISEKLEIFSLKIRRFGKLNLQDIHGYSEDFYCELINIIYGWSLVNLNGLNQNADGIDLIDDSNKIIVQVSATNTRDKVQHSIDREDLKKYEGQGYIFKFVSIANDCENLRTNLSKSNVRNPYSFEFDPHKDIIDISSLLRIIKSLESHHLNTVYEFIKENIKLIDENKLYSNLALIINVISSANEDFNISDEVSIRKYNIENKIRHNKLSGYSRALIEDKKAYFSRLEEIYEKFDELGSFKRVSVLDQIQEFYYDEVENEVPNNQRFLNVCKRTNEFILSSSNRPDISSEELGTCVKILIVHSFIICNIFEKPENYEDATAN